MGACPSYGELAFGQGSGVWGVHSYGEAFRGLGRGLPRSTGIGFEWTQHGIPRDADGFAARSARIADSCQRFGRRRKWMDFTDG